VVVPSRFPLVTPAGAIAVLHLGALGDLVVALPAIHLLRRTFGPRARVHAFVAGRAKAELLVRSGAAHEAHDLASAAFAPLFASGDLDGPPRVPASLAALAPGLGCAAVLLRDGEAVCRGLRRLGARRVIAVAPRPDPEGDVHVVDHLVGGVCRALEREGAPRTPRLRVASGERAAARADLLRLGIEPGRGLAMHPGSGGAAKRWPLERFLAVARAAEARLGRRALALVGPVEAEADPGLAASLESAGVPVVRDPPLPRLAALVAEAGLYLGNDAGPSHAAAAVGARALTLFGPSSAAVWAPRGPFSETLIAPRGALEAIGVDQVLERLAAISAFASSRARP